MKRRIRIFTISNVEKYLRLFYKSGIIIFDILSAICLIFSELGIEEAVSKAK